MQVPVAPQLHTPAAHRLADLSCSPSPAIVMRPVAAEKLENTPPVQWASSNGLGSLRRLRLHLYWQPWQQAGHSPIVGACARLVLPVRCSQRAGTCNSHTRTGARTWVLAVPAGNGSATPQAAAGLACTWNSSSSSTHSHLWQTAAGCTIAIRRQWQRSQHYEQHVSVTAAGCTFLAQALISSRSRMPHRGSKPWNPRAAVGCGNIVAVEQLLRCRHAATAAGNNSCAAERRSVACCALVDAAALASNEFKLL